VDFIQAIILSIVEGLTEYLPISSTGHLILTSWLLGNHQDPFVKDYTIMVQFGAIVAVLFLYWRRFLLNTRIYPQVLLGFLPAAAIGLMVKDHIDALLGNVWVVGWAMLIGGILLVLTDHWMKTKKHDIGRIEDLKPMSALQVGVFQCLAFVPGVSRSAASIWGGLFKGMNLPLATEFSFFLAVPTLAGAGFLKLMKVWPSITPEQLKLIAVGNLISFVVGALAIKFFVSVVARSGLKMFGYYRIALGLVVLGILMFGHEINYL
jgi:undecaprenyl-diphosphatase